MIRQTKDAPGATAGGEPLDVLLVDDNPDDRALVRRALRQAFPRLDVTEVGTRAGFRDVLGAEDVRVVITDYELRWGNGLEVLHQVRARWPECVVLMFTDSGSEEIAARAMKNGLDDYVVKTPRHAERLPVAVRQALDYRMHRERARVAEAQIRQLFDRLPAGVYRVNSDERVLYANETLAELMGYDSADELIGVSIADMLVDTAETEDRRASKQEGVTTSTVRLRRKDGRVIWVRDSGRLVHDVDGTPMYYEGVIQDVTRVHEAQLEVRRQSRFVELLQAVTATANEYDTLDGALEPALHLIRSTLDWPLAHVYRPRDGVLRPTGIWDDDGSDDFAAFRSTTAETTFAAGEGLPGRALARGRAAWMEALPENREFIRIEADAPGTFRTGVALPVMLQDEVLAILEFFHTESRPSDEALLRVLDKAGVQLGRVAERERADRRRQEIEAAARQAQRLEAVGRLAGGIAHDFNNLLTVVRSQADLLHADLPEDDALREEVEAIQMAADRAAGLTSQLLAFSRKQELETQVVDLEEIASEMVRLLDRIIGDDIAVVTRFAGDLPPIDVDPTQLEHVLVNLAVNARHAMPHGGTLTLATAVDELREGQLPDLPAGRYVCLRVTDTGIGMDEETRERIFEPFFTTKSEDQGSGLGLAMAHGVLKQFGGGLHVDSAPGEGATFYLRFPPSKRDATRDPEPERAAAPERSVATGRVLVVEDEPSVRAMIEKSLDRSGFTVRTAPDAETGLELLASDEPYDLLLTDLLLPGMTGVAMAEKAWETHPDLRVIVMSGYTKGTVSSEGRGLPDHVEFLPKPFTVTDLVRAVQDALID